MSDYLVRYTNNNGQDVERELTETEFFSTMVMIEKAGFVVNGVTRLRDAKDLSVMFSNREEYGHG